MPKTFNNKKCQGQKRILSFRCFRSFISVFYSFVAFFMADTIFEPIKKEL
jgi:hypothetical protein